MSEAMDVKTLVIDLAVGRLFCKSPGRTTSTFLLSVTWMD